MKDLLAENYQKYEMARITEQMSKLNVDNCDAQSIVTDTTDCTEDLNDVEEEKVSSKDAEDGTKGKSISQIEQMIMTLKNDSNKMISPDHSTVLTKPRPNTKCMCGSKRAYKKCCAGIDKQRTNDFIQGKDKVVEQARKEQPKAGQMILI